MWYFENPEFRDLFGRTLRNGDTWLMLQSVVCPKNTWIDIANDIVFVASLFGPCALENISGIRLVLMLVERPHTVRIETKAMGRLNFNANRCGQKPDAPVSWT